MSTTIISHEYMSDMVFQLDEYCRSPLSHSVNCISNDHNFFVLYLLLLVYMTDDLYYTFQDILNLQYTTHIALDCLTVSSASIKRHAKTPHNTRTKWYNSSHMKRTNTTKYITLKILFGYWKLLFGQHKHGTPVFTSCEAVVVFIHPCWILNYLVLLCSSYTKLDDGML